MTDIIDLLLDDHDEVRDLFSQLEDTSPEEREDLFRHIAAELARHEAAEEAIVHPTLEKDVGDAATASSIIEEEQEAEELMAEMENMDPASDDFLAKFRQLRDDVLEHAEHEERDEFPQLREQVSAERRAEMAEGFEKLKSMAPTHPHPQASNEPAAQVTLGPIIGIFDRARDAAREAFGG